MNESNLLVKTIIFYDDELKEFLFELESILTIQQQTDSSLFFKIIHSSQLCLP